MKINEFVSDHVIQTAKRNLESSSANGRYFVPVAIANNGAIIPIYQNPQLSKKDAFTLLGAIAYLEQYQYVVYVMDVRVRPADAEEMKIFLQGEQIPAKPFPPGADEALMFMVMPFTDEVKGATGMWRYAREGTAITWLASSPLFTPDAHKDSGFYSWSMSGYQGAEKFGLRPAKGK